ncbi:AAEL015494-PA [Aedes aegypti]|uniref:AAEL015494-PA n=1 Tax=Aedes aegypti TaxID=7159 RepID=Q1DGT2_AEDAE|nr:AAEL015494-PB [Aedes aegypti]EAT32362.1 AAEL015494-PA [Aedes aegypti]
MGLFCSCLEDKTQPIGRNDNGSRHGGQSTPPFVYIDQPRPQQRSANQFLAPMTTSSASTTIRVVQQPAKRRPQKKRAPARGPNLLIDSGVTVRIAPRTISQQVRILEVQQCDACGQSDHTMAVCRYRERLCFYCREEGHIISVCPAKKRQQQRRQAQRKRQHATKRY